MNARDEFRIIDVPAGAPHAVESMGTKPKFWYHDKSGSDLLFKQARPGTGEDWSEKIAAEVADLLGLPHARYELASCAEMRGTVSPSFVPKNGELVHGSELLKWFVPGYPSGQGNSKRFYRLSQHTLDSVLETLRSEAPRPPLEWSPPAGISDAAGVFVGYLLLDVWIGNTDRHHQNWGVVCLFPGPPQPDVVTYLAPTFDHASSLGRELPEEERRERMATRDRGYAVEAYVEKCRSALYARVGDTKPLTTLQAFAQAAQQYPGPAGTWLERLASVRSADTASLLRRVPRERISTAAIDFAEKIFDLNRQRLLDL